ncbi:MAG: hypothetical protein ACI955_001743 [Zhongshania sp.]
MFLIVRLLPEGDSTHAISPDFWVAIEKPYDAFKLSLQSGSQDFKSDSPLLFDAL